MVGTKVGRGSYAIKAAIAFTVELSEEAGPKLEEDSGCKGVETVVGTAVGTAVGRGSDAIKVAIASTVESSEETWPKLEDEGCKGVETIGLKLFEDVGTAVGTAVGRWSDAIKVAIASTVESSEETWPKLEDEGCKGVETIGLKLFEDVGTVVGRVVGTAVGRGSYAINAAIASTLELSEET